MTKQEAIKVLKKDLKIIDDPKVTMTAREWEEHDDHMRDALEMAIEALGQEPKWIPVTERLPTLNDDGVSDMVLLCWSDGQRTVGAYRGDRTFVGQAWPVAKDVSVTVTAWMPLPESYEEGSEQLESDGE